MSKQVITSLFESNIRDITTFGGLPTYLGLTLFILLLQGKSELFSNLFMGIILIMLIAILIRTIYYKARPKELPHDTWLERLEASSFPSIHAARSWFLAFLFGQYFASTKLWILLSIAALAICYSRYHRKRHDLWDLLGGFGLAVIVFLVIGQTSF